MELLDSFCRKQMLQRSCTLRTSLVAEANRKVAQLAAKKKSTGLGLSADHKGFPGGVRQEGKKYRGQKYRTVYGYGEAAGPSARGPSHWPSRNHA